jgi:hypothetical protein
MIGNTPQNWWQGNQFMMPQLQPGPMAMPQTYEQWAQLNMPKMDNGILSTSGVAVPDYVTEGKSGAEKGPGGVGNSFSYGAPEYGMEAGKSADATTTTTSSKDWGEVARMGLMNAIPGISTLYGVTGMTSIAKDLAREYAEALGLASPSRDINSATALADQQAAAQNAYGDQQGFGNEGGLGVGADPSQAGNTGDASSESPGLYNKGGWVGKRPGHYAGGGLVTAPPEEIQRRTEMLRGLLQAPEPESQMTDEEWEAAQAVAARNAERERMFALRDKMTREGVPEDQTHRLPGAVSPAERFQMEPAPELDIMNNWLPAPRNISFAAGGRVGGLFGPNPPGPDTGFGGLMGGEYVVKAKAAKKRRGLLDAINSGADDKTLKGLLG